MASWSRIAASAGVPCDRASRIDPITRLAAAMTYCARLAVFILEVCADAAPITPVRGGGMAITSPSTPDSAVHAAWLNANRTLSAAITPATGTAVRSAAETAVTNSGLSRSESAVAGGGWTGGGCCCGGAGAVTAR